MSAAGGGALGWRSVLPDGDVGGGQGLVPGGVVLRGGAVAGAGLEQVTDVDELGEHVLVGGAVGVREQARGGQDVAGLGAMARASASKARWLAALSSWLSISRSRARVSMALPRSA